MQSLGCFDKNIYLCVYIYIVFPNVAVLAVEFISPTHPSRKTTEVLHRNFVCPCQPRKATSIAEPCRPLVTVAHIRTVRAWLLWFVVHRHRTTAQAALSKKQVYLTGKLLFEKVSAAGVERKRVGTRQEENLALALSTGVFSSLRSSGDRQTLTVGHTRGEAGIGLAVKSMARSTKDPTDKSGINGVGDDITTASKLTIFICLLLSFSFTHFSCFALKLRQTKQTTFARTCGTCDKQMVWCRWSEGGV